MGWGRSSEGATWVCFWGWGLKCSRGIEIWNAEPFPWLLPISWAGQCARLTPPVCARYREHEDGYMRLQLVRYESVELTEQLLKDREKRGEALDGSSEYVLLPEGEGNLQGILLEPPASPALAESRISELPVPPALCSASSPQPARPSPFLGASSSSSSSQQGATSSPIIRVVNRTNEQGQSETVYYVLASTASEGQGRAALAAEPEENVMDRLQKTAEELGIHIV